MKFWIFSFLVLFILVSSCERQIEDFDPSKFGFDYFPLEIGGTWIYQVDSVIYDDDGSSIIETSSQIKEVIVESYEDVTGEEIFRIERFWRQDESKGWMVTDVWVASKTEGQAYRTEENLKFVKFVFPALEGSRWNGNIFFDSESTIINVAGESIAMFRGWDDCRITSLDQAEEIEGKNYEKVATVLLTDDREKNSVERRFAVEKYARGVGLVYKEYIILDSQKSQSTAPWTEKAEKGFILKQRLIEHN